MINDIFKVKPISVHKANSFNCPVRHILLLIFAVIQLNSYGQVEDTYYLPDIKYNTDIPNPESILKYQIGEWHITHDQLYYTVKTLCEKSENCVFNEIGRTHENRPLVNLIISSKSNIENLESLRKKHNQLTDPTKGQDVNIEEVPLVLYQGYSVHGNESSGSNAVPMIVYYLLAGESEHLEKLLDETIVIIDPCYNPDGLQRFSTWANSHKHLNLVADPIGREFNEVWPGGRTNHYWFDLNRDWIFNIHPSSKARIKNFHYWKPDILTDHHEMGSNRTFFFQPGIPSRTNPNTPQINQDLTEEIGTFHATALDSIGSLYYSKESFDDFYYGKGSTYPDIQGAIGILFEQASSRGHLRQTSNGLLSFPFTIRNQFVTALSTQKAGLNMKSTLLKYKRDFFKDRYEKADNGYFIFEEADHYKANFFVELMNRHQIDVYQNPKDMSIGGQSFSKDISFIVPKKQRQTTLVQTIFETVNTFRDSLFYDVSAWTLPLAFDMKYAESNTGFDAISLNKISSVAYSQKSKTVDSKSYAIAIEWYNYMAPTFLYKLLDEDIKVKVVTEKTKFQSEGSYKDFEVGTLIIPLSNQPLDRTDLVNWIESNVSEYKLNSHVIDTGFSPDGKSLGSPQQNAIEKPRVAMIIGQGVNAYEAGATWHQMDQRMEMPVVMIDKNQIRRADLSTFNVIILPDGTYSTTDENADKIKNWVNDGGTLIAMRRAINFVDRMGMTKYVNKKNAAEKEKNVSYTTLSNYRGAQVIGGAIYQSVIDLNHPLFYGYKDEMLPIFKRGTQFYEVQNTLATPLRYASKPLLSGYTSDKNIEKARNAAGIICSAHGSGQIISLVDNPNFRGYWLGGSKLFANALFFHGLIDSRSLAR